MKKIKFYKEGCLVLALSTNFILTGCNETYVPTENTIENTIDTNEEDFSIDPQVLDIPNEDFKLVVSYDVNLDDNKKWRITSDKDLYIECHTEGLEDGYKVWIDNVHIDTFIVSTMTEFNGILQDTMDDRIHNSMMMGFPISDTMSYSSINLIEGQDKDFIEGTYLGYLSCSGTGFGTGSVEQERYTDQDYLEHGVYANKIGVVFGLLIQGPNDTEPYGVDVKSEVYVTVYNKFELKDGNTIKVFEYDTDGTYHFVESYKVLSK